MKFNFFNEPKPRIFSPLVGDDEHIERNCGTCKIKMPPLHRNEEDSSLPWRERGIDYKCENCNEINYVANSNSISIAVGSAIVVLTIIGLFVANGLVDYILFSLQTSVIAVIVSLISIVLIYFALQFSWSRVKRGAELIEGRFKHPLVNRKPGINMINLSLTMGVLPWLIAITFGYMNESYHLLEGGAIWLALPFTLLPIAMGRVVGSTKMNVFLATMFWLLISAVIVWMAT